MQKKLSYLERTRLKQLCIDRAGRGREGGSMKGPGSISRNFTPFGLALTIQGIIEGDYFHKEELTRCDLFTAQKYFNLIKEPQVDKHNKKFYQVIDCYYTHNELGERHEFPIGTVVEVTSVDGLAFDCKAVLNPSMGNWLVHQMDLKQLNMQDCPEGFLINWANDGGFIATPMQNTKYVFFALYEVPIYGGEEQFVKNFYDLQELVDFCNTQA